MSMLRPGQPFRAFGKHDEYVDLNILNVLSSHFFPLESALLLLMELPLLQFHNGTYHASV
jgi:hypothetical protein